MQVRDKMKSLLGVSFLPLAILTYSRKITGITSDIYGITLNSVQV